MIAVGASWIADGIVPVFSGQDWLPVLAAAGSLLFLTGSVWLWRARRTLLGVQTLQEGGLPKPHRFLVATLSPSGFAIADGALKLNEKAVPLATTTQELIKSLQGSRWNGEMLLRAIDHHADRLERISMIATPEIDENACKQWDALLERYYPKLSREWHRVQDSESLDEYRDTVRRICEKAIEDGFSMRDIIIDVTGGQKIASIGAAEATLEHPGLEFQYVSTKDNKIIRSYNAQTVHEEVSA